MILPKAISAGHAAKETRKHSPEVLKSNETVSLHKISKYLKSRSQTSAQATEIIKNASFAKILTAIVNVPPKERFAVTVIGKNHFKKCCLRNRKTPHEIEQTETESPSADE